MEKSLINTDNLKNKKENIFIIQPLTEDGQQDRLEELKDLIYSADGVTAGYSCQKIREINPATFIGKGKLEEIKEELNSMSEVDCVLFDGELSPSQTLNISAALNGIKVIDRTTLILDIFALHATTLEGKIQVELAQLKYIYPRLKGKGEALSRLGGGIGTRGPGETKLETDRRHIRERIRNLEKSLEEIKNRRNIQSERRKKNNAKFIALVGYTNTGKSTLLNKLTGAGVLEENKLFATLDPTLRKIDLEDGEAVIADTVGFLRDIPHNLIEAFKSTLETAAEADLILNVCDASSPIWEKQLEVTADTLKELNCKGHTICVVNKCDLTSDYSIFPKDAILISAKNGIGTDKLLKAVNDYFSDRYVRAELLVPYQSLNAFNKIKDKINLKSQEYTDDGLKISASIPRIYIKDFNDWLRKD